MKRYAELTWIRNVRNADKKPHDNKLDYRGDIGVILINNGFEEFVVKQGDRIAQMIISKVEHVEFELVKELNDTKRNSGGFGSTGIN